MKSEELFNQYDIEKSLEALRINREAVELEYSLLYNKLKPIMRNEITPPNSFPARDSVYESPIRKRIDLEAGILFMLKNKIALAKDAIDLPEK